MTEAANDDRPAAFDAQLVAAMPLLRRRAWYHVGSNDVDDLVQLTLAQAMRSWKTVGNYAFSVWLLYQMRAAARDLRAQNSRQPAQNDVALEVAPFQPSQDSIVELSQVRDALRGRPGEVVWRNAQGEDLASIGRELGISKQAVNVMAKQERERLAKRLNTNRSMRIAA